MANVSSDLLSDDLYRNMLLNSIWQNQISSGANIANMGGKTALGLMIGMGLGNWLGNKFYNYQRAQDDKFQFGKNPAVKAAVQNLFGDADLGWKPPNQYQFKPAREYLLEGVAYNPNWRQAAIDKAALVPTFTPAVVAKPAQQAMNNGTVTYVDTPFQQPVAAKNQYDFPVPNISELNPYNRQWYSTVPIGW